jgi:hypothetical protein
VNVIKKQFLTAILVVLSLAAPGAPAYADDPAGDADVDKPAVENVDDTTDVVDASDPGGLQAALTDFKAWINEQPGIADSGYIESVNNAAASSTTLLWHGSSPLQQTIIDNGSQRGIDVTIEPRDYDRATLEAAALEVLSLEPADLDGFQVSTAFPITADYDGLVIEGTPTQATVPATKLSTASVKVRAAGSGTAAVSVRAKFVPLDGPASAPSPIAATRDKDFSPYNAGGFMRDSSAKQVCSTGFAIRRGGENYTTTARHCWYHAFKPYNDASRNYGDGVVNSKDGAGRQMSAHGSALMFDGAYNNTAGYNKKVIGYGAVSIGDKVCVSGGNSGVHCGLKIFAAGAMFNDGFSAVSTIVATSSGTAPAATHGDSGGPVFVTAGTGKVRAVGMMQWADFHDEYLRACSARTQIVCSSRVGFTLMSVVVNTIPGASLVVTS